MKAPKIVALGLSVALAAGGFAGVSIITAGAAQADTTVNNTGIKLFSQINNNSLSGVQNRQPTGTPDNSAGHAISIVVSPSTTVQTGGALGVTVSSSTLVMCSGPASPSGINATELDAVIVINGTEYLLRGPQNTIQVNASAFNNANHAECKNSIFDTGWVVSSAPGGSSGNSTNTVGAGAPSSASASTGLGTATPAAPTTIIPLTAPATPGSYQIGLKGLVLNSITGSGTAVLTDVFDQFTNLDSGGHSTTDAPPFGSACDNSSVCAGFAGPGGIPGDGANSPAGPGSFLANDAQYYISAASATPPAANGSNPTARDEAIPASTNWSPVTLTVTTAPNATINSVTNLGTDGAIGGTTTATDTPINLGTGGVPYLRALDALAITGNAGWGASVPAANLDFTICPVATAVPGAPGGGCAPFGVPWYSVLTGTKGTDGGGQFNPVTIRPAASTTNVGSYAIWAVECSAACAPGATLVNTKKMPVQLLGPRTISTTATKVKSAANLPVTGSNWYPGESVAVKGGVPGTAVGGGIANSTAVVGPTGTVTVTVTTASAHGLTTNDYVKVAGSTNTAGPQSINIVNAKVSSVGSTTTFSYTNPLIGGAPSTTLIASAADTGIVRVNPGTASGTDVAVNLVASGTGALTGNANTSDATSTELYATGIQNGGAVGSSPAQNYAEGGSFVVDNTAPTGTADLSQASGWTGGTANLTITATDVVSPGSAIVATVNWGEGSPQVLAAGVTTASHVYSAVGTFPVTVTLTDEAGNVSSAIGSDTFTVTTAPTGSYSKSAGSLYATQSLKITPTGSFTGITSSNVNWGDGSSGAVSTTAATSHKYTKTGTFTVTATLSDGTNSVVRSLGTVKVTKDTLKPTVTISTPSKATKGSSWKTIKGKASDKGLGVSTVKIKVILKKKSNGDWYYLTASKSWKKASSKSKAKSKASWLTDKSVSSSWSISAKKPAKGKLYVYAVATDKAGNKSAEKSKSQTIKS